MTTTDNDDPEVAKLVASLSPDAKARLEQINATPE